MNLAVKRGCDAEAATRSTSNAVLVRNYARLHAIQSGGYIMLAKALCCGLDVATRKRIWKILTTKRRQGEGWAGTPLAS